MVYNTFLLKCILPFGETFRTHNFKCNSLVKKVSINKKLLVQESDFLKVK